jgi:hypothetical protein
MLEWKRYAYAQCICSSQDCFKAAWASHKSVHTKLDALTSQLSQEGWKYCLKKGRIRTLELHHLGSDDCSVVLYAYLS